MQVFDNHSLESMPESLRNCDLKQIDVCLELELLGLSSLHESHVEALQRAVGTNTQRITTVKFHLHGDDWSRVSSVNQNIVAQLVETVSHLPNLKDLSIVGGFAPLPAVTDLLVTKKESSKRNNQSSLESLRLENFRNVRTYDTSVLVAFCQALGQSNGLRTFSFIPHTTATLELQEDPSSDLLFEALASLPSLKYVRIASNARAMTGPHLQALCRSTALTHVELKPQRGVEVDIIDTLVTSTTIQEILMSCVYSDSSSKALTRLIESNSTLTKLTLIFRERCKDDNSYEEYILPLARALSRNSTLSHLKLSMGQGYPTRAVLQAMVSLFRTNFTLSNLELFDHASRVQYMCYEDIEKLEEGDEKAALQLNRRIQFYTMMNCSGRGALLEQTACAAGRLQWIEKLAEYSYSLDHIYYFLGLNPTLCSSKVDTCGIDSDIDVTSSASKKRGREISRE